MGRRRQSILALIAVLAAAASPRLTAESPAIVFSPAQWDFGTIPAGTRAFLTVRVINRADHDVTVSLLPTCGCLSSGPSRGLIAAGSQAEFRFSFLAEDDERGEVRETFLVQTDLKALDHFYYQVHGTVGGPAQKPSP